MPTVPLDATKRELKGGQWVVQSYSSGRNIRTRIAYIISTEERRVRLTHFTYYVPGEWQGQRWVPNPAAAKWERASPRYVSNVDQLTIIDPSIAFGAQDPGLQDWIENVLGGDPMAPVPETV